MEPATENAGTGAADGALLCASSGGTRLQHHQPVPVLGSAGMALMPMIGRAKVLRSWGGIMDMTPDGSPIIDKTPIGGLYIDCGWNYGGFKAVPASGWCMAHLMATDQPHPVAAKFRLDRFATGHLLDEEGTGSQHNLH